MKNTGCIYILTNPSFPNYVKIGYASNLEKRLKQLNRSETVPFAFRVHAIYEVEQALTDVELHKLIDSLNPDLRSIETFDGKKRVKEFYAMSQDDAYNILECIAKISGTTERLKKMKPEGHEIEDEKTAAEIQDTSRRGPLKFSECQIPVGAELKYSEDPSITVVVVDDRHVLYNGETTSLTAVAKRLKGTDRAINGTLWFKYRGEFLNDIRDRLGK